MFLLLTMVRLASSMSLYTRIHEVPGFSRISGPGDVPLTTTEYLDSHAIEMFCAVTRKTWSGTNV